METKTALEQRRAATESVGSKARATRENKESKARLAALRTEMTTTGTQAEEGRQNRPLGL